MRARSSLVLASTPGGKTPVFHDTTPKNECHRDVRNRGLRNKTLDRGARRKEDLEKIDHKEKRNELETRRASDAAKVLCRRGQDLEDSGDLTEAEAQFREALAIKSRCSAAPSGLGRLLEKSGDLTGAEARFRNAMAIDSQYSAALSGLGHVLKMRGDLAGAEAQFRAAAELLRVFLFRNLRWVPIK